MGVPYAVIDTEARSASKYADRFTFEVDNLTDKTVERYLSSMKAAEEAGYKILLIDSLSHAWREMIEEVDRLTLRSNSKNTFTPWAQVSPKQKQLIEAILNYPGHIIATMRSKTEWVIGTGKDGKMTPEKIGLAPEQGKGIEFEFDILVELTQWHEAIVTKDRTGKFQDEKIEKPGEEFGVVLYEWLASGKAEIPTAKTTPKPQEALKKDVSPEKPAPAKRGKKPNLKEERDVLMKEIADVMTANKEGEPYFSEVEKEDARNVIKGTSFDEKGLNDLKDFKAFLSDELAKRVSKKAA
jgi:hypothetical protein